MTTTNVQIVWTYVEVVRSLSFNARAEQECPERPSQQILFLETANVKPIKEPILCTLKCETTITVFRAQQIKSLVVEQENDNINPRSFEIVPTKEVQFLAKMKIQGEKALTKMKGTQFPIVSNSATTGHKFKGYTAE